MGWRRERDERPPIDVVGAEPGGDSLTTIAVGPSGSSRSKAPYVVALAVAALVGGLVLGGGGDEDDSAAAEDATTTTERSTSTTRRRRPTTTSTSVMVPPGMRVGADVRILLIGGSRGSRLVDLGTGEVTPVALPTNEYGAVPFRHGAVLPGNPATYVPYDGGDPVPLGDAQEVLAHDASSVWLLDNDGFGRQMVVRLVDLTGRLLAGPHEIPGWIGGAQSEGLVVQAGGRVFRMALDGSLSEVGVGDIRSVSNDHLIFRTCDERARCRLLMRSGDTEPVELDSDVSEALLQQAMAEVSADGQRVAVVSYDEGGPILTWVDLAEGVTRDVGPLSSGMGGYSYLSEVAWLPGDLGLIAVQQTGVDRIYENDGGFVAEELLTDGADRVLVIPG